MITTRLLVLGLLLSCALMCVGAATIAGGLIAPRGLPFLGNSAAVQSAPSDSPSVSLPAQPGAPRSGQPAPDFSLNGTDKQTLQLSQFRGKPVMVNFWATWCGPCSAEMPNIEKVYEQHSNGDVVILAVNQNESADQVQGYADLYRLHFPILLDNRGQVGDMYRVQALPTTIFIDRTGIIREIHIGGPMSPEFIEGRIQSLLK